MSCGRPRPTAPFTSLLGISSSIVKSKLPSLKPSYTNYLGGCSVVGACAMIAYSKCREMSGKGVVLNLLETLQELPWDADVHTPELDTSFWSHPPYYPFLVQALMFSSRLINSTLPIPPSNVVNPQVPRILIILSAFLEGVLSSRRW
ncbi:hypothetical protein BDN72DRAFT_93529 [Pluteus cervinus]|uniref:Uncharacterized protein n=1 Tax=Pluteus cervinus TaxID=181527 RepID=A0ACD3AQK0_9AGAR|nr:hypothetical protein BDN72DRAFT_93529 [Pluteus cervinus]